MPKTLEDIQNLLESYGYECERKPERTLTTRIPTKVYISPAGQAFIEICLKFDKCWPCVAVESLRVFDIEKAAFKQEALSCLLIAAARTPLLKTLLNPTDGGLSIRIDCPCYSNGARGIDVLRAVAMLPAFVDAWAPQVAAAVTRGTFDPNAVTRMQVPKLRCKSAGGSGQRTPAKKAAAIRDKATSLL